MRIVKKQVKNKIIETSFFMSSGLKSAFLVQFGLRGYFYHFKGPAEFCEYLRITAKTRV